VVVVAGGGLVVGVGPAVEVGGAVVGGATVVGGGTRVTGGAVVVVTAAGARVWAAATEPGVPPTTRARRLMQIATAQVEAAARDADTRILNSLDFDGCAQKPATRTR
jgi:hypothetical protein